MKAWASDSPKRITICLREPPWRGSPELQIPSHMFIYTSDYYQGLIEKANLTNPTELVSSGEDIEIQHVCIDRNLPPCVLIQAYYAPNLPRRTNGQVKLSVISYAELQIDGTDALNQVGDGTVEMINIFTGYVAGGTARAGNSSPSGARRRTGRPPTPRSRCWPRTSTASCWKPPTAAMW